jgi:hypothetical protein
MPIRPLEPPPELLAPTNRPGTLPQKTARFELKHRRRATLPCDETIACIRRLPVDPAGSPDGRRGPDVLGSLDSEPRVPSPHRSTWRPGAGLGWSHGKQAPGDWSSRGGGTARAPQEPGCSRAGSCHIRRSDARSYTPTSLPSCMEILWAGNGAIPRIGSQGRGIRGPPERDGGEWRPGEEGARMSPGLGLAPQESADTRL